ncbi:sensor histidine kinase [Arsenicibacter rosenii]|nr:histidine kinase [Arsenicibacter rosenii]
MLFGKDYFGNLRVFTLATLSIIVFWTPIYFLHALPAIFLRKRFPAEKQALTRLCIAITIHMFMSGATICGFFYGYRLIDFPGFTFNLVSLQICLAVTWFINIILNILHEYIYTMDRWKQTLLETEELKRANLQSQLDGLKQQVNPHFLFNSLNSLTALISEDPKQAELFAEELSSVYRYVLRANERTLTELDQELDFVHSYYQLLKTRYNRGLDLTMDIDKQYGHYQIPPLTLQLLVENAVKHNIILPEQPLQIHIQTSKEGKLSVQNNLQKKSQRVLSNGVGLSNIISKYQVLGHPIPIVKEANGQFVVTLPLILS